MTTRGQVLRSSTPGQKPAAGTRLPGEIWTTFPDKQLGIIDASKTAQPMIAVRFFSTSANYVSGDFVVQAGGIWVANTSITAGAFNPSQWRELAYLTDIPAIYVLPIATTSVLGGVKVDGVTVQADANGVLSSAGLVSVSATPPSPVQNGALWYDLVGGQLYAWVDDGTSKQWVIAVNQNLAGGVWLPLTGGALSGALSGPMATFANLSAPQAIGDNRIINGDMRIDQRNNGAAGTANSAVYTADRWMYQGAQASKGTWQRQTGSGPPGFPYYLAYASSSAYASLAADYFVFSQPIEADMVSDFAWGTANAQPVMLSFWVLSSLSGTFSGALRNGAANNRSYPFSYQIPIANTWTKIAVTIPGDTGGTWTSSGNTSAVVVSFDLGSGANQRGPAGAWTSTAPYLGVTGAVSIVGTNSASFYLTGVKLEIGSVATPFNRQSLAKSMADCQRYYQISQIAFQGYNAGAGAGVYCSSNLPVQMRASPTMVILNNNLINVLTPNLVGSTPPGCSITLAGNATNAGYYTLNVTYTASAEL